jgi:hypothetical protein
MLGGKSNEGLYKMKDPGSIGTAMDQSLIYQPDDQSFFSIMVYEPIFLFRVVPSPLSRIHMIRKMLMIDDNQNRAKAQERNFVNCIYDNLSRMSIEVDCINISNVNSQNMYAIFKLSNRSRSE